MRPPDPAADALMARLRAGDAAALDGLMARLEDEVYRFAVTITLDADTAHDVTQETFLRVFTHAHTFRAECPARPWVMRIARNVAFDLRRREARHRRTVGRILDDADLGPPDCPDPRLREPADVAAAREVLALVRAAIPTLPGPMRRTFEAVALGREEYAAVARRERIPPGTVRSRVAAARVRLADATRARRRP